RRRHTRSKRDWSSDVCSSDLYLFPWEHMINTEQQHHMNYYKFVNMFTDVKQLEERAVRRSYLDPLLWKPKPKKFNENYVYLYLRSEERRVGKACRSCRS